MEFYKNIIPPESRVLEIGSGTGRLAMPLIRENIDYYGLDLSKELCDYSKKQLSNFNIKERIIHGDMRSFNLDMDFDYIFIAFNSFLHILTDGDAIKTFQCIKNHLNKSGKFILDILVPNPDFLYRGEEDRLLPVMDFKDSRTGDLVEIFERCEYNSDTEVCDLNWEYRYKNTLDKSKVFSYQMRMYYPDTINRLLIDSGFDIEDRFGDYECGRFNELSQLQIYVCR
jgi:SAM-dependent methyltransferase|tara:strand:- start:152 stop:832 length:681 start_codon:yes stop_codon:yes gene_type:complete